MKFQIYIIYLEFHLNRTIKHMDFVISIIVLALFSLILIVAMAVLSIGICIYCLMKLMTRKESKQACMLQANA